MAKKISLKLAFIISLAAVCLMRTAPAHAHPILVGMFPEPDSILSELPSYVELTFDRALTDDNTWLTVTDEFGQRLDLRDAHVLENNRFTLRANVDTLPEGRYFITYHAVGIGNSVIAVGRYEFMVDLPDPELVLLAPERGYVSDSTDILVEMQTAFVDFDIYNTHIHLYVDGELHAELRQLTYMLTDLEPGVHEITTVLFQFDEQELPSTASTAYIAVVQPDIELEGRASAAVAPPDQGLQLTYSQWIGGTTFTVLLLALGVLIDRLRRWRKTGAD